MLSDIRKQYPFLAVQNRRAWRSWLRKHHLTERGVWLLFRKQRAGGPTQSYEDAVQEALCFGWIDSLIRRIDERDYARLFTPRKQGSAWSAANVRRVRELIRQKRMTTAGLRFIGPDVLNGGSTHPKRPDPDLPSPLRRILFAREVVRRNFLRLPPGQRRLYIAWIMDAKREQTRRRRIAEAAGKLGRGEPLGMK